VNAASHTVSYWRSDLFTWSQFCVTRGWTLPASERSRRCFELSTSSAPGLVSCLANNIDSILATAASDRHGHDCENDALMPAACSLTGDRYTACRPTPTALPLSTSSHVVCCCCNNCQNSTSSSSIPRIAGPALLVREMTALPYAVAPTPRNVDTLCRDDVVERRSDDVDDQNAELSDADGTTMPRPVSSDGRWAVPCCWVNDTLLCRGECRGDLWRLQPVVFVVVVVGTMSLCVTLLLLRRLRRVLLSSLLTEFRVCLTASLYLTWASRRRLNQATCYTTVISQPYTSAKPLWIS